MFFYLSKIAWLLIAPTNLLLFAGLFGVVLLFTKFKKTGRFFAALSVLGLFVAAFTPVSAWVLAPLESRFPVIHDLEAEKFDGIIVLGGATDVHITRLTGEPAISGAGERALKMIELARRYPDKPIAFAGGGGVHDDGGPITKEADVMRLILERSGLPTDEIVFEDQSRNTWQNAVNVRELLKPAQDSTWLLVTSAFHMPRSVGVFRQAGFNVRPVPVDFRIGGYTDTYFLNESGAARMARLDIAMREWVGLVVYYLSGRSNALFPGP